MQQMQFYKKEKIAQDSWQFWFVKPEEFLLQAGQYITLFLHEDNRDFTVCMDLDNKNYFSIVTKKGKSEFKKNLFSLQPNRVLQISEPLGGFVLNKNNKLPKVFLAGGIGITPFYSMIYSNKNTSIPLTLFASFSKKENVIFYNELQNIQRENKNIRIIYTLSQEKWDGEEGRISEKLVKKYVPNIQSTEFMIAGGEQMVYDTEKMLLQMKVPQEKIRVDIFTGY